MGKTEIEWCDKVWNPVTGCTKVSEGCRNCYAERIAKRFWGERKFSDVQCHEDRLDQPLHWKKPQRIFVNSMSDLFHENVPIEFISKVFNMIKFCSSHTFIVLTKRPERILHTINKLSEIMPTGEVWPIHNLWLGVSVEDQETANERIPWLLKTPAAVRFVSYEPALDFVDFAMGLPLAKSDIQGYVYNPSGGPFIDWIIMGGETGPGARPMSPDWARFTRDECRYAKTPFFFKHPGSVLRNIEHEQRNARIISVGREFSEFPGWNNE